VYPNFGLLFDQLFVATGI